MQYFRKVNKCHKLCLGAGCLNRYMVSGRKISNEYHDISCKQVLSQANILNANHCETIVSPDSDWPYISASLPNADPRIESFDGKFVQL